MGRILWEELAKTLEEENILYRDILELSKHKTGIIVEGKVSKLEQLMKVEQGMILRAGKLEQRRIDEVNRLARYFGVSCDKFNISLAIDSTKDEDLKTKLVSLKDGISSSLKELKEVNDLNGELIEKSLEYIDFSINLIGGKDSETTYNGKKDRDKGGNFFDQKA